MLFRLKYRIVKNRSLVHLMKNGIVIRLIFLILIHRQKTRKHDFRTRACKTVLPCIYFHGSRLIFGPLHPARHKSFPYDLIQPELFPRQRIFYHRRRQIDIGRADRLVGILYFLIFFFGLICSTDIFFSIVIPDKRPALTVCLIRNTGRIRSKIRNKTNGSSSFDRHTLIKLLRHAHRLLCREIQVFRTFLLQRTRRKRYGRLLRALSFFDIRNDIFCAL